LKFNRSQAYGKRLDIPAGTAVRFEPGETKTVKLVDIAGRKVIRGGNNLASGKVSAAGKEAAVKRVTKKRFATTWKPNEDRTNTIKRINRIGWQALSSSFQFCLFC